MGLKLLKEMGLDERHHYIDEKSYISMPKLLSTYGEEYFDFIFIDEWYTFDYTLIDFFYAVMRRLQMIQGNCHFMESFRFFTN